MILSLLAVCAVSAPPILAQQMPSSRAEEIEQARQAKVVTLAPDTPSGIERGLAYMQREKILERVTAGIAGFRVKFGGLANGSGFALGPEYLRRDLAAGNVTFRGSAAVSTKNWQLHDLQLTLPKLANDRLRVDLLARYRNFAGINYYGPGPDSKKTGRSVYRLEDTLFVSAAEWRVAGPFRAGGDLGYLLMNVGPGDLKGIISADRIYTAAQAPGIERQPNFLRSSVIARVDWRDYPGEPRHGGNYFVRMSHYSDRTFHRYDFRRVDVEAQQYIPFLNARRVIALRARNTITDTRPGQVVPFYLQPTLGGSDDLRGFRPFRFYGDNAMVFNAEYRWETFTGLDMALFVDAGKVSDSRDRWKLNNLEGSAGFGFRFNVRNSVFMRIDVGFSHEGFQAWVKFNNVF